MLIGESKKFVKSTIKGRIEFENANFHYFTRSDVPVLNLTIGRGETVALVGSSGLVERVLSLARWKDSMILLMIRRIYRCGGFEKYY